MVKGRLCHNGLAIVVALTLTAASMQFMSPKGKAQQIESRTAPQMSYEEAVIRWAYLKLAYYNSIANRDRARLKEHVYNPQNDIILEVRNVHTGHIAEVYDKTLDSLVTKPSGAIVSLTLYSNPSEGGAQEQIAYSAEWGKGQYTSAVAPQEIALREALQVMGEKYADVKKYSSYEVNVRLAGISRTYNALVLYHGTYQSSEEQKPEFLDAVVGLGGVITDIWNEARPPIGASRKKVPGEASWSPPGKSYEAPKPIKPFGCDTNQPLCCRWGASSLSECKWNTQYPWDEPKYTVRPDLNNRNEQERASDYMVEFFSGGLFKMNAETFAAGTTAPCSYINRDEVFPFVQSRDSKEHFAGDHMALTQINVLCKRTSNCVSTCDPYLDQSGYSDYAAGVEYTIPNVFQPVHAGRKQASLDPSSSSGSSVSSLTCKGGAGYAFKSCLFESLCSVSLSLSWSGATLNASGGELWNVAHSRSHTCYFADSTAGGSGGMPQCGPATGLYCYAGNSFCLPYTFPSGSCCCSMSPIVIDVSRYWDWATNSGNGYKFTDVAGGVRFDLNGDGSKEQVAWTTATSENAWLALDRNGNGAIDNGKELFGNFTDQVGPSGEAVAPGQGNGWQALAEFDRGRSGGNDNGVIDAGDAVFQSLRLWVDRNHNGISEPNELITLPSIGLTRIELGYADAPWTDQYGNNFRLRARFIWGSLDQEPYVEWYKNAWDVFPLWTP